MSLISRYQPFIECINSDRRFSAWEKPIPQLLERAFAPANNKDLVDWERLLMQLPAITPTYPQLIDDVVTFQNPELEGDSQTTDRLEEILKKLQPWRLGPYAIGGVSIDGEWRSERKWNRLKDAIEPLEGKIVLDVGCNNGYHLWRMALANAQRVIGVDPYLRNVIQFLAVNHFSSPVPVDLIPATIESLPVGLQPFDTIFSLGVLCHRKSPQDHLRTLFDLLHPDGELVLETCVIDGTDGEVLYPGGRYAKMRNVWCLPSPPILLSWLRQSGFADARIIDINTTTIHEQRSTPWMHFESLADFLDGNNPQLTIEGHPAPRRALSIARKRHRFCL